MCFILSSQVCKSKKNAKSLIRRQLAIIANVNLRITQGSNRQYFVKMIILHKNFFGKIIILGKLYDFNGLLVRDIYF